jgi:hypothetical protein
MSTRPALQIQTIYFADTDEAPARELGLLLYDRLTRPRNDRLAFGPGIQVRVAVPYLSVDPEEADHVVLVPILGAGALHDEARRQAVLRMSTRWSRAASTGHLLPVLTSEAWRAQEARLGVKPLLTKLSDDRWDHTMLAIVVSTCRLLREPGQSLHVFVSHAKRDPGDPSDEPEPETKRVAEQIRDFVKTETIGEAFFDTTDLRPGRQLEAQLEAAAGNGVFLAVRTDSYSSRAWCQKELLSAKRMGVPTLTVELLRDGEHRSSPYGGNGPTVTWTGDPHPVVRRAMIEWLRSANFRREASRLVGGLPRASVLTRPPELLDLAQGPLYAREPEVVLHPDPEVARAEREVLRAARPRLRLVTPTTLYRGVGSRLQREEPQPAGVDLPFAPLRGRQIAMSLSNILDNEARSRGLLPAHVDDCIVHVARSLISAGAAIAYGGDFRPGGFDELLAHLISAYNENEVDEAELLVSYIAATVPRSEIPEDLPLTVRGLGWTEPFRSEAILPPSDATMTDGRRALHVSDMRRVMTVHCFARIAIGGQAAPRSDGANEGYGGAYPGVVEEVWWSVRDGAPAYVVGGFGGAAGAAAALLDGEETPAMQERNWSEPASGARFRRISAEVRDDPFREKLGVPAGMDEMADSLRRYGRQLLASDDASRGWNGLTVAENRELFRSRDVVRITGLVVKGLLEILASRSRGKLRIELVRGSITQVEAVDAVAIGVFQDVQIMGAGAALDAALSGRVSAAIRAGESLAELSGAEVDADWLLLADLGDFSKTQRAGLPKAIADAAATVGRVALRHGFGRLGVVTFGGTIAELDDAVGHMVDGFRRTAGQRPPTLQWLELDGDRFKRTRKLLEKRDDVELTTRVLSFRPADRVPGPTDVVAVVRWRAPTLECTLLPPSGVAALGEHRAELPVPRLAMLAQPTAGRAPRPELLARIGLELANLVFGKDNTSLLERHPQSRLVIQHDAASSAIPFETLRVGDTRLSVDRRMIRRPSLEGLELVNLGRRPPSTGDLRMLLVVNPTGDLEGTEREADEVRKALVGVRGIEIRRELWREQATKAALLAALSDEEIDVLHYAGHAFFDKPGFDGSGIECADGTLGLRELSGTDLAPRAVFFNACQSARVRRQVLGEVAQAFAEYFLRAGIEAYVGTFWPVSDVAAAKFAGGMYRALARGEPLDEAVRLARAEIAGMDDWANYVLYGDGGLRIHTRDGATAVAPGASGV